MESKVDCEREANRMSSPEPHQVSEQQRRQQQHVLSSDDNTAADEREESPSPSFPNAPLDTSDEEYFNGEDDTEEDDEERGFRAISIKKDDLHQFGYSH